MLMKIVLSVTHPYLDGGRVGARDEWKIAGAEKGGDQVIPRILLILISSLTHSESESLGIFLIFLTWALLGYAPQRFGPGVNKLLM